MRLFWTDAKSSDFFSSKISGLMLPLKRQVSSANNLGVLVITLRRSFMYNRNSKGLNVDPCSKLYGIAFIDGVVLIIQTNC